MNEIELLTKRRRQLRYRANHRGIKEMDIILGRYGDEHLEQMQVEELDQFEKLMEENDRDLLQWFTAEKKPPEECLSIPSWKLQLLSSSARMDCTEKSLRCNCSNLQF